MDPVIRRAFWLLYLAACAFAVLFMAVVSASA